MPDAVIGGVVGPQAPRASDGSPLDISLDPTGAALVSERQPRYFELAWRKTLFTAYCLSQAISVAGAAMVGLQLWNASPVVGGVNLVLLKIGGLIKVSSATTVALALATGSGQVSAPTGQTAATRVANNFIGGPGPQALALAAGTFTNAPTALVNLMHNTAAIATTGEDPGFALDFEGSIVLPPQTYCAIAAVGAAVAAAGADAHLMWAELPV